MTSPPARRPVRFSVRRSQAQALLGAAAIVAAWLACSLPLDTEDGPPERVVLSAVRVEATGGPLAAINLTLCSLPVTTY